MATTAKIELTESQIEELATQLRVSSSCIPKQIAIVAIAPEAGIALGISEKNTAPQFSPAVIIT